MLLRVVLWFFLLLKHQMKVKLKKKSVGIFERLKSVSIWFFPGRLGIKIHSTLVLIELRYLTLVDSVRMHHVSLLYTAPDQFPWTHSFIFCIFLCFSYLGYFP